LSGITNDTQDLEITKEEKKAYVLRLGPSTLLSTRCRVSTSFLIRKMGPIHRYVEDFDVLHNCRNGSQIPTTLCTMMFEHFGGLCRLIENHGRSVGAVVVLPSPAASQTGPSKSSNLEDPSYYMARGRPLVFAIACSSSYFISLFLPSSFRLFFGLFGSAFTHGMCDPDTVGISSTSLVRESLEAARITSSRRIDE